MKNIVLIVDDRPSNLIVFEEILSKLDVTCVTATSGEEAFAQLTINDISLILLDVQLPGMDGFEILKIIRKTSSWKDIPVLFISAVYKSDIHQIKGINLGAFDFITKPIIPEILSGKIKIFLELYQYRKKQNLKLAEASTELEKMVSERTRELEFINKQLHIEQDKRKAAVNIINASPAVAFRWKNTDKLPLEYVSENVTEISGYSVDELLSGKVTILSIVHHEDIERVSNELISFSKENNKSTFTHKPYRILKKNGDILWVDERLMFLRNNEGFITHFQGIIIDITDRKKAELELAASLKSLHESEELFRTLSEASFESIFLSREGKCILQNKTAEEMFGYTMDEAFGMYGTNWIIPDDREKVTKNIMRGVIEPYSVMALRKNGTKFPCEIKARMSTYKGKLIRITSLTDISERVAAKNKLIIAKEKAVESDRLKTAFLANMSHEIRTPMNAILGFSQLLAIPGIKDDEINNYIETINNSGKQLLSLIDDIISISQIEAGIIEVHLGNTSVEKILKTVFKLFSLTAEGNELKFSYQNKLPDKHQMVSTDSRRIQQVLINLLNNAFKFTPKGSIKFGCSLNNNNIEFYVSDTGIGINKADEKMIFDRFMKADHGKDVIYGGTGIGLSISKAIVEKLGGSIWIESKKTKGSEFRFTIPFIEQATQSDFVYNKNNKTKPDLSGKTILIAEDEEYNYKFLNIILKNAGAKTLRAITGKEVIAIIEQNKDIDLILMDVKMPTINGIEATKQIRKMNIDIPIIAQTAYAQDGDRDNIIEAGCDDYIAKPIQKNKLFKLISKYI